MLFAHPLDAYRNLTEQVYGLYVESATQMGDLSLVNENVRARVQGLVMAHAGEYHASGGETYETKLALEQEVIDEQVSAIMSQKRVSAVLKRSLGSSVSQRPDSA